MAKDKDSDVRNSVAANRNTPVTVIEMLVKSEECVLQGYLADIRQALEMETQLERGVEPQFDDVGPNDILRGVMLLGTLSPHVDNKELAAASRSTDWLMRLGSALHPAASDDQLKLLSQDVDADVASAAVLSLSRLRTAIKVEPAPVQLAALVAPCPTCKGLVKEGVEDYSCGGPQDGQQGRGCGFAFKKTHAGRTFTVGEAEQLVRDGRIGPLKGFISKAGAPFAAQMFFNFNKTSQNYRLQFDFDKDNKSDQAVVNVDISNQTSLGQCPKCSGDVYEQEQDYVCINSVGSPTNPKPSCNFKTGRNVLQQPISPEQVGKLLSSGRTDLLDGFVSSRTQKKFTAMLVWDARAGKVGFEFTS